MDHLVEKQMCEAGTGIVEHATGYGKLYADGGVEVTPEQAYDLLRENALVEVPNAGSATFRKFFIDVGFAEVDVFEWSSSAGDWTFVVRDGDCWYPAFQHNRYPYHGFKYLVDAQLPFPSKDALFNFLGAG